MVKLFWVIIDKTLRLFCTILSFYSMLAQDSSCAVSGKFVQSWRQQQSVENKCRRKVMLLRRKCTDLFPVQFSWSLLDNTQGFWLCNVAPRVLRQYSTRFFRAMLLGARQHRQDCTEYFTPPLFIQSIKTTMKKIFCLCNVAWSLLHNITQSFYLCNVVPRALIQHWTRFVSVQRCLEPLGQHCTKFLPVQCCPKSIKTTLNKICSCAMLSGASCTTLNKVFACCAILSQEY